MTKALSLLFLLCAACGTIISMGGSGTEPSAAKSSFSLYVGPECGLEGDPTREQEVLGLACGLEFFDGFDHAMQRRHVAYDDRRADPLAAALQLVECTAKEKRSMSTCERDPAALGIVSLYADAAEDSRLVAALAPLAIPDAAKQTFAALTRDARTTVTSLVANLDSRRTRMYVTGPLDVIRTRAKYYRDHASAYQRFDDALRSSNAQTVQRLESLRSEYLAACRTADCIFEPFVIDVTKELVRLHLIAKRDLLATAEQQHLNTPGSARHTFGVEIGKAVYVAMAEEQKAHAAYVTAKAAGMDATTLAARFGAPPPLNIEPTSEWTGADTMSDPTAALAAGDHAAFEPQGGIVKSIDRSASTKMGDTTFVRITFDDDVTTSDITSCYDTNKIVGVDYQGDRATLRYDSVCTTLGQRTKVIKNSPVWVPSAEARAIRRGENLSALTPRGSVYGVVVSSRARGGAAAAGPTRVLQIRGQRIGGS